MFEPRRPANEGRDEPRRNESNDYRRDDRKGDDRYGERREDLYRRDDRQPDYRGGDRRDDYRRDERPRDDYRRTEEYRRDDYPRRDDYRERPRDDYRGDFRGPPRDEYRGRRDDFRGPPRGGPDRPRAPPRFGREERDNLRIFQTQYGDDWEAIGREMRKPAGECREQWLSWDSQPEWEANSEQLLIQMHKEGATKEAMLEKMPGRSMIGLQAKLDALSRKGLLNTQAQAGGDTHAALAQIISESRRLVGRAKGEEFPAVLESLKEIAQMIERAKDGLK